MYQNVRISKSNIKDLIPIFSNAFKTSPNFKDILSKYDTKAFGAEYLGYITYYENYLPVAFYGVLPLRASINKSIYLIAQSGDTMTHSNHIGKGLFIKGAQLSYELCIQNHLTGIFGFPSKSSFPTFKKKLNWKFLEKINNYSFYIPTIPVSYFFSKYKLTLILYRSWVNFILFFYKKGITFSNNLDKTDFDYIYHDDLFWKYKLKNKNNYLIQINSVNVIIKIDNKLSIGDMSNYNTPDFKKVIMKLKILSFLTFNFKLDFYTSPGTIADIEFSKIAKPKIGLPVGFLDLMSNISLQNIKFTYFDFDTF